MRVHELWVTIAAIAIAATARAIDNAECLACHEKVDEQKFSHSIHGKNLCTSCHTDIAELPHQEKLKPVSCSQCHRVEADIYLHSDHGQAIHKGVSEAASCKSCHGDTHTLLNSRDPASPVNRANIPATCAKCHGNVREMEKFDLRQRGVVVTYEKSVHGIAQTNGIHTAAVCTDCHGSHDLHRSTNPQSKLYWQTMPATCGKCHDNVRQTYNRSVHGKAVASGIRDAPVCTDCHGEHTIQAVKAATSKVAPSHIPETCGSCHGAERIAGRYQLSTQVVSSYMQSFHGLAQQFGGATVANCASCHGFHDILPSSDPLSSVNKANLPQTCGKCHPGIGTRLASGEVKIHNLPGAAKDKPWLVNFVTWFYIAIIIATIGGMGTFNLLDYLAKARVHIRAVQASPHAEERLPKLARLQHAVLIVMFVLLAYTGFVHKFPETWWSWPFKVLPGGGDLRGLIHRICGWAFAGLFVVHLIALFCTARGHAYLRQLWVARHDLTDFFTTLAGNLRLRPGNVPHRRFNYAEKAEYWALVWGSFVMILTGAMLIFTETVLRMLPKVWHDVAQVIHFYEAVLATLAIVVWHFYWVIFDPKEFPMNPAWLIGKKAGHQESQGKGETPDVPH